MRYKNSKTTESHKSQLLGYEGGQRGFSVT